MRLEQTQAGEESPVTPLLKKDDSSGVSFRRPRKSPAGLGGADGPSGCTSIVGQSHVGDCDADGFAGSAAHCADLRMGGPETQTAAAP